MKRYILTSKRTQLEHELNQDEFNMLKSRVNVHRLYNFREVPERKPVPKPSELGGETPHPTKRVVEPKPAKHDR